MFRCFVVIGFVVCLIVGSSAALAGMPSGTPAAPNIGKFLGSDGSLDLATIRASGYQGALDLAGYGVRLDGNTGQPRVRPLGANEALDDPDDVYWQDGFGPPGVGGTGGMVNTLTYYNGRLIAGGSFTTAGGIPANRIAAWDGVKWSPLGSGMTHRVTALTVYDGKLIAAGDFTAAGGIAANRIAAWDGSTWSPLGSGLDLWGRALTVYGGRLIVGGFFTSAGGAPANYIAAWDGATWSPLGTGMDYSVYALTEYDGKLIAGGEFTTAGGTLAEGIAAWDGVSWSALGSGVHIGRVNAATVYNGHLYIGGAFFETVGGIKANHVAYWNGTTWFAAGTGVNSEVRALAVHMGNLIVGGDFVAQDFDPASHLNVWNEVGGWWLMSLRFITNGPVHALAVLDDTLAVGGRFTTVGAFAYTFEANNIAEWPGELINVPKWRTLPAGGMNGDVYALAAFSGKLVAGGLFTTAGGRVVTYLAAWDGVAWLPIGGLNRPAYALTVYDNKVIVGGAFTGHIAAWDGAGWSGLGTGMDWDVTALGVHDSKLIAGGGFTTAGGVPASCIAAWDGVAWSALGAGVNHLVYALASYGGALYAGGAFDLAGGVPVNHVARWDGVGWSAVGAGTNSSVYALAEYQSQLVAGGAFTQAGGSPAVGIAAWNGSAWSALGSGMGNYVHALAVHNGKLFAGGFTTMGGSATHYVQAWNGSAWSPLGSGTNGYVYAMATFGTALMVGGDFSQAGGKPGSYIAGWTKQDAVTAVEQSIVAAYRDAAIEVSWELSDPVPPSLLVIERAVTGRDYVELPAPRVSVIGVRYVLRDEDIAPTTSYRYRIGTRESVGPGTYFFETPEITTPPMSLALLGNYPNPFHPSTLIRYYLPHAAAVTLTVHDAAGRLVASLAERESQPVGHHALEWNGRDRGGRPAEAGVYFCQLSAAGAARSLRVVLLR